MNTKDARKKLKAEIAALNRAYEQEANKGCQPKEDWPYYERNLATVKRRVDKAIDNLIMVARTPVPAEESPVGLPITGPLSFGTR